MYMLLSNQKHPRHKKEQPRRTKTGLADKDVKSNWQPMPLGFDSRPVTRGGSRGSDETPILTSFLLEPAICLNTQQ